MEKEHKEYIDPLVEIKRLIPEMEKFSKQGNYREILKIGDEISRLGDEKIQDINNKIKQIPIFEIKRKNLLT